MLLWNLWKLTYSSVAGVCFYFIRCQMGMNLRLALVALLKLQGRINISRKDSLLVLVPLIRCQGWQLLFSKVLIAYILFQIWVVQRIVVKLHVAYFYVHRLVSQVCIYGLFCIRSLSTRNDCVLVESCFEVAYWLRIGTLKFWNVVGFAVWTGHKL